MAKKSRGYNLNRVCQVRDLLFDKAFDGFVGLAADKYILEQIAKRALKLLPSECDETATYRSLEHLAGRILTRELCYEVSWRLSGNWQRLKRGEIVRPWNRQTRQEWIHLQILSYEYQLSGVKMFKDGSKQLYHAYKLQVMAGSSCPMRLIKSWTRVGTSMVAKDLGFTRSWGLHPYKSPWQLVGMRLMGQADPEFSNEDRPGFREIKVPSSMVKWNRSLLVMRERLTMVPGAEDEAFDCMEGFDVNATPCHRCFRGYESCPAATHPYDFQARICSVCDEEAYIDTNLENSVCINCAAQRKK